jgi:hypothetical protein
MKTSNVYYDRNKPTSFSESKGSKISSHQEIHKNSPIKKKKGSSTSKKLCFQALKTKRALASRVFLFFSWDLKRRAFYEERFVLG